MGVWWWLICHKFGGMVYNSCEKEVMMKGQVIKKLGEGGFANVYLVNMEGMLYACKRVRTTGSEYGKERVPANLITHYCIDEINCLRCLDHPNIVRCYGFGMRSFTSFDIYFEYIKGKTIDIAYKTQGHEDLLLFWVFQLCRTFVYLEKVGIVHRDIKPKNILVNNKGLIKLIDFGISKMLCDRKPDMIGSPSYISPQTILQKGPLDHKSDIWSLGVTIYELTHQKLPFSYTTEEQMAKGNCNMTKTGLFKRILTEEVQISRLCCSQEMCDLINKMLQKDPELRIGAQEILELPLLKSREPLFKKAYSQVLEQQ